MGLTLHAEMLLAGSAFLSLTSQLIPLSLELKTVLVPALSPPNE